MKTDEPPKPMDLTKLNLEAVEEFFTPIQPPSKELATEKQEGGEKTEDEFEIRRKQFFDE